MHRGDRLGVDHNPSFFFLMSYVWTFSFSDYDQKEGVEYVFDLCVLASKSDFTNENTCERTLGSKEVSMSWGWWC